MLFSLVLAVASKEVELWQTFDDFAPRLLQDDMEEDLMVGDDEQEQDGFEGELDGEDQNEIGEEEEEEAMNPLVVAAPVVLAGGALAAYFLMNGGKKDDQQQDGFNTDNISIDGLKEGKTEAVAAAGLATVGAVGLASMFLGGGSSTVPAAGFLANNALALGGGATALIPVYIGGRYITRESIDDLKKKKTEAETDFTKAETAFTAAETALKTAEGNFSANQKSELKDLNEKLAKITEDNQEKKDLKKQIEPLEKLEKAIETAKETKDKAKKAKDEAETKKTKTAEHLARREKGGWKGLY